MAESETPDAPGAAATVVGRLLAAGLSDDRVRKARVTLHS